MAIPVITLRLPSSMQVNFHQNGKRINTIILALCCPNNVIPDAILPPRDQVNPNNNHYNPLYMHSMHIYLAQTILPTL